MARGLDGVEWPNFAAAGGKPAQSSESLKAEASACSVPRALCARLRLGRGSLGRGAQVYRSLASDASLLCAAVGVGTSFLLGIRLAIPQFGCVF